MTTFLDYNLSNDLMKSLKNLKFHKPTEIQEKTIPIALNHNDVLASAEDAAKSIGVDVGSIAKSLVFRIGGKPVMALISGNSRCNIKTLHTVFGLSKPAKSVDAAFVKKYTGFSIGGVAPVAHLHQIPIAIDVNLGRFSTIYAAAGHPHCVFSTNLTELRHLTRGVLSDKIGLNN